jgi:hypothetical protein
MATIKTYEQTKPMRALRRCGETWPRGAGFTIIELVSVDETVEKMAHH